MMPSLGVAGILWKDSAGPPRRAYRLESALLEAD